ncbi:hypothetical protein L596_027968 [Steinernema carpocapsae]|uniref:Uncharacterized protein n=1 Tax=Steinernema carpocapsae TaxID=34508 RepID=A0A4U5LX68_STECR|nr:hypothetical protein L596_027968 [Steinernema carpocapsae]
MTPTLTERTEKIAPQMLERSGIRIMKAMGSKAPYNVTVFLKDASSSAELLWQITVAPTYTVKADSVAPLNGTNKFVIRGDADFRSHSNIKHEHSLKHESITNIITVNIQVIPYTPLILHVFTCVTKYNLTFTNI